MPISSIRNPQPSTLTLNTQHSTLNTQHSTLNSHSTLNTQHSTLNQTSTAEYAVPISSIRYGGQVTLNPKP